MKPSELDKDCFYCRDGCAVTVREIPIKLKNGYKLIDFKDNLCEECNNLDDKTLSNYFSI